jgi:dihydroflavonol-4-reductase
MILVTGATGLVGSHLLFQLIEAGEICKALYRSEHKIKLVEKLFHYYNSPDAEVLFSKIIWVKGDLNVPESLESLFLNVDYVYHCAAKVSFFKADFEACMKENRNATANVVNYSLKNSVKKLCYVSSTAAIGSNPNGLTTEETLWAPGPDVSGYSISKFSAEKEVWRGIEEGLPAVILNPCLILGPGDWQSGSLSIFRSAKKGLLFYTSGSNAVVDVRDVARSMCLLMNSSIVSERFLCIGENVTFQHLFTVLSKRFNTAPPKISVPKFLSLFAGTVLEFLSQISRKRNGFSIETAHSSYKNISYDKSKLIQAIPIQFYTLEETIDNAIRGQLR